MNLYMLVLSVITKFDFNTLIALNGYFALKFENNNIHKPLIGAYLFGSLLSITLFHSLKQQFSVFVLLKYSLFLNWMFLTFFFIEIEFIDNVSVRYWLAACIAFGMASSNLVLSCASAAIAAQMHKTSMLVHITGIGLAPLVVNLILLAFLMLFGEANTDYLISSYLSLASLGYIYLLSQFRNFEASAKTLYEVNSLIIKSDNSLEFRRSLVDVGVEEQPKSDASLITDISNIMFGLFFVLFVFIGCFPGLILQYELGLKSIANDAVLATIVNFLSVVPRLFMHVFIVDRDIDNYVHILTLLRFAFFKIFKVLIKGQTDTLGNKFLFLFVTAIFALSTGFNITYYTTRAAAYFSNQQNKARSGILAYYATIFGMFCGSIAASLM